MLNQSKISYKYVKGFLVDPMYVAKSTQGPLTKVLRYHRNVNSFTLIYGYNNDVARYLKEDEKTRDSLNRLLNFGVFTTIRSAVDAYNSLENKDGKWTIIKS